MSDIKESTPLLKVQFNSVDLFRKLGQSISEAIETVFKTLLPEQCVDLRSNDGTLEVFTKDTPAWEEANVLFVIDSTPMKNKKIDGPIPSYKKIVNKVYDGQNQDTTPNSLKNRPRKATCWNCDGDHGLKDCKEPRNFNRIRQKKEQYQKKPDRYHADIEQKYGYFAPGKLSRELRDALGLGSRDLPLHIYKMRKYGYPPGWLEDAKVTHSGLQLFDSNGDVVQYTDDSEVDKTSCKYDVRKIIAFSGFNVAPRSKMFDDFKFYNVPPFSEELSREKMIEKLQGTIVCEYRRKKLKLSINENGGSNSMDVTENLGLIEMNINENGAPVNASEHVDEDLEDGELLDETEFVAHNNARGGNSNIKENPLKVITFEDSVTVDQLPSTALQEMKEKQQKLVEKLSNQCMDQELDGPSNEHNITLLNLSTSTVMSSNPILSNGMEPSSLSELPPTEERILPNEQKCLSSRLENFKLSKSFSLVPPRLYGRTDNISTLNTSGPETIFHREILMNDAPSLDERGRVGMIRMALGTPILPAFTPYSSLPSGEAFSKGVSDVINFENLPNSTGKYEKLKSMLLQARQKMIVRDQNEDKLTLD